MATTKHFIEFCDHIFAIEDIQYVERYYSYNISEGETKKWNSLVMFNTHDHYFKFPEVKYEELKKILISFGHEEIDFYDNY